MPLHDSTTRALREYSHLRDRYLPGTELASVLRLAPGLAAHRRCVQRDVREADPPGRPGGPRRAGASTSARSQTLVRCQYADRLVSRQTSDVDAQLPLLSTYLGHVDPASSYWYLQASPELTRARARTSRANRDRAVMSLLAPTLQAFFTDRLITQRDASPRTVAAYRDTFRLLLAFAEQQTGKQPSELDLADLDAPLIGAFLNHLEQDRGNSASTRNARLAAIHSFYRYAALQPPRTRRRRSHGCIAIPTKRHERNDVSYLTKPEIDALLGAPDRTTWLGRRDHALLLTAITTGLRVSELVALRVADVTLGTGRAHPCASGRAARNARHH